MAKKKAPKAEPAEPAQESASVAGSTAHVAPVKAKKARAQKVEEADPDAAPPADGPQPYPKRIYGKGRLERTVADKEEHKKWAAKGYKDEPSEEHLHDLGVDV